MTMENEAANLTLTFPADYSWQHVIVEGDEECRVRYPGDGNPLPAKTEAGPEGTPASPAHDS